ncbi:MAG: MFS transporter [Deltaproteobacteria bacterium]|nr:MFS transporter [Deltaproteobacteria bacterium]
MKKPEIFYGWWIVFAVFFISAYANGVVFYSFTAILEPLVKEFGWSYARASFAASIRGFETSFLGPLIGVLFDRFGPRRLIFAGGTLIGLGLLLLSRTTAIATFYFAFFLMATGLGSCAAFMLTTVVGNWFRRNLSIASGIALCGGAAGGLLVPLVTRLIDLTGWRTAMVIIGLAAFCVILPLSLIVRHKPEQYGYLPDGDKAIKQPSPEWSTPPRNDESKIKIRLVLSNRSFWHISLGFLCHYLAVSVVLTHIMPYLSTIDISRTSSSLVASGIPLISILGRISYGWLGDRLDKKRLAVSGYILIIMALLLLIHINNLGRWILLPFLLLFGLGFGGPIPMAFSMLLEYFGRGKSGTVVGTCMAVLSMGNILGPPLAGWIFDYYGSYQVAWFTFLGVTVAGIISLLSLPRLGNNPPAAD